MNLPRPVVVACLAGAVVLAGQPARAQSPFILMPGEVYSNVPAAGYIEKRTARRTAIADEDTVWEESFVGFSRLDPFTQIMKVYAWSKGGLPIGAEAIAQLRLEFCVPRPGLTTCDEVSDPAAPDIAVKITFGYGIVGQVRALGWGSKAEFHGLARVMDLERNTAISYQNLETLSAARGTIKTVAKIPVPIPDYKNVTFTSPAAFSTVLKRGRRYQFQLRARAYAMSWDYTGIQTPGFAVADMRNDPFGGAPEGFVSLRDLSFEVSPAPELGLTELREAITSLQEQLGSLSTELDALRASLLDGRGQPGSGSCETAPPGPDWSCVNGGWVPPDHPSAVPGPPSAPPSTPACTGSSPAPGWICVRGGWVPPDHPAAREGG